MKRVAIISGIAIVCLWLFSCIQSKPGKIETTTYYLVRHAEKAVDGTEDPDLSDVGRERAQKIAGMLKDKNVQRLYTTAYKRTQQTLQPLADTLGLKILVYDHRDAASVAGMIEDCKAKTCVIAGHSNSIPALANTLIREEVYPELDETDYSRMWEINIVGDKVTGHKVILY